MRRVSELAGQATLTLTGLRAHFDQAGQALMQVSTRLQVWAKEMAERLPGGTVRRRMRDPLKLTLADSEPPKNLPLQDKSSGNCGF